MSYARLEELDGIPWPCYDETHPGEQFLHARLWERPVRGARAPFAAVEHDPPVEALDAEYPVRLTTGRRLDSFNTGVQSGGYSSPLRRGERLDISPDDAARYRVDEGDRVRVTSRRGSVVIPVHIDTGLRAGLVFTTFHHNDEIATNLLTIDATDPKSGTAEFKAAAVRIDLRQAQDESEGCLTCTLRRRRPCRRARGNRRRSAWTKRYRTGASAADAPRVARSHRLD